MDLQLAGKVILVTGATSGIGLAAAHVLAAEGAHVAALARGHSTTAAPGWGGGALASGGDAPGWGGGALASGGGESGWDGGALASSGDAPGWGGGALASGGDTLASSGDAPGWGGGALASGGDTPGWGGGAPVPARDTLPPGTLLVRGDLTDPATPARAVTAIIDRYGRLDGLVNNAAALTSRDSFTAIDDEQWHATFELNLHAAVRKNPTTKPAASTPEPEPVAGLLPSWSSLVLPGVPPVPVRVYVPEDRTPAGLLVWAHGGSWQHGSAAEWHHTTAALAARSGWAVISVDYRLAPRHRHPSAVQDVLTALTWAHAGTPGTRLAVDASEAGTALAAGGSKAGIPLAVGGDSAGGTIAACAALAARDRGLPLAAQVLAYPPFDPGCAAPSYHRSPSAFPQAAALRGAWRAWLGDNTATTHQAAARDNTATTHHAAARDVGGATTVHDADHLYATPWQAPTLAGVAPAILAAGRDDPVHDDVVTYARRLHADGVPARLLRPPGARHGDMLRPDRPLLRQLAAALRELTPSLEERNDHECPPCPTRGPRPPLHRPA